MLPANYRGRSEQAEPGGDSLLRAARGGEHSANMAVKQQSWHCIAGFTKENIEIDK